MPVKHLVICLCFKTYTFVPLSLTSSKLYTIYNNLLNFLTQTEDFIHYITNKGQLIYDNNLKLYKFLFKLKHSPLKQVPVVFKISGLMDLYIKELKNNV